jgi:hypothetical protein
MGMQITGQTFVFLLFGDFELLGMKENKSLDFDEDKLT